MLERNNRIIVVDDDKDICESYKSILSAAQHSALDQFGSLEAELFHPDELILEDPVTRSLHSFDVTVTSQGTEAVEKIYQSWQAGKPYAVGFIDMRMPPGIDGLETMKRIRQIDTDIELVIVTAYSDHMLEDLVKNVPDPSKLLFLKKPFSSDEISQLALALTNKWNMRYQEVIHRENLEKLIQSLSEISEKISTGWKSLLTGIAKGFTRLSQCDNIVFGRYTSNRIEILHSTGAFKTNAELARSFCLDHKEEIVKALGKPIEDEVIGNDPIVRFPLSGDRVFIAMDKSEGFEFNQKYIHVFLQNAATSLLNMSLYKDLKELNETLEFRVRERTKQLSEAMAQLQIANEKLEKLSITDELTGLYNRRYFKMMLSLELKRVSRTSLPLSCVMCDLDYFKNVNDTHGHPVGDFVLTELAKIFKRWIRETDLICRYGGDEFVMLLPATPLEGACVLAERARENIAKHIFIRGGLIMHITASFGVSCATQLMDGDLLVKSADDALYKAKNAGRNCTRKTE